MAKFKADWEKVAAHYRAGIRSLRDIADEFGITEGAIRKRAKAEEWPRDLSERIKSKADDLVRKSLVRSGTIGPFETDVIAIGARAVADVRLSHRTDIARFKNIVLALLNELDEQTSSYELFSNLGKILRAETDAGVDKLNDIYQKVIATPGRIDSVKKLSESLRILVTLEREAWNIKEESSGLVSDLNKILEEIGHMPKRLPCDD